MLARYGLGWVLLVLLIVECSLLLQGCGGENEELNLWVTAGPLEVGTYAPDSMPLGEGQMYYAAFTLAPLNQGTVEADWQIQDLRNMIDEPGQGSGDFDLDWSLQEGPPWDNYPCTQRWVASVDGYYGADSGGLQESTSGSLTPARWSSCNGMCMKQCTAWVCATFTPYGQGQPSGPEWRYKIVYITES